MKLLKRIQNSRILYFTIVPFIIVSCGKKDENINSISHTYKSIAVSQYPIKLIKTDTMCTKTSHKKTKRAKVNTFINGKIWKSPYRVNLFSNSENELILKSDGIYQSMYNSKYSETYTYNFSDITNQYSSLLSSDFINLKSQKEVNFCENSKSYGRLSVEAATINVSKTIETVSQNFKTNFPDLDIDNIILDIGPIQEITINKNKGPLDLTKSTYFRTDGASYNPFTKKITFYPPSNELVKLNNFPFFWEIPTVAAHEYGHHIFNSITSSNSANFKGSHDIGCYNSNYTFIEASSQNEGLERPNFKGFSIKSLNESFADLFAYYSLSNSKRKLKKLNCLSKVREVNSSRFSPKHKKVYSAKGVEILNDPLFIKSDESCSTPNFQEVHDVGAIFAHGFDKLISKVTSKKKTKLKILINWLNLVKEEYYLIENNKPIHFLFHSMELAAIAAGNITDSNINEIQCSDLNYTFPSIQKKCLYLK